MEAFRIEHLSFSYPLGRGRVLDDVSFSVNEGEFFTLCGLSGSGKSTLLRHLKPALTPHGEREGSISFFGSPLSELSKRDAAARIGFVLQNPENQIATDKVWHELAFGLESLGMDDEAIRLRVSEMVGYFGLDDIFHSDVASLSGGQKQLVSLAGVMAMQPDVLILDEPTAQLDPVAAASFLDTLRRISLELGTTIVLSEQDLERALTMTDTLLMLTSGRVAAVGKPACVGLKLRGSDDPMFCAMPAAMRVWAATDSAADCPLSVRDGRRWLGGVAKRAEAQAAQHTYKTENREAVIELKNCWFRYERHGEDVLRGLELTVLRGEILALVGANGSGKSTALRLMAGLKKPWRGRAALKEPASTLLPQDPDTLFVRPTVLEDLEEILDGAKLSKTEKEALARQSAESGGIAHLLQTHPYDLSGGEKQRAALCKLLLLKPKLLLLDEPTKGMDASLKRSFALRLRKLKAEGVTTVLVCHDLEFAALCADRCAMLFDGTITALKPTREFFAGNAYYTTAANRMARQYYPSAITVDDVAEALKQEEL